MGEFVGDDRREFVLVERVEQAGRDHHRRARLRVADGERVRRGGLYHRNRGNREVGLLGGSAHYPVEVRKALRRRSANGHVSEHERVAEDPLDGDDARDEHHRCGRTYRLGQRRREVATRSEEGR